MGTNQRLTADDVEAAAATIRGSRVLVMQLEVPSGVWRPRHALPAKRGSTSFLIPRRRGRSQANS
jgi:hypothetical protein